MMVEKRKYSIPRRLRRLRRSRGIRVLVEETEIGKSDLIMPIFVIEGDSPRQEILAMPGQFRLNISDLVCECERLFSLGIPAVAFFPVLEPSLKDDKGTEALNEETLVLRAVRAVKKAVPDLIVITDIALDPYTSHGHDGVLNSTHSDVNNDQTVSILTEMAKLNAFAGVDFVAPSDMMDGRIGVIRKSLDNAGFEETGIIAYSAKFASSYYGPFRDAIGSAHAAGTRFLGKETYQLNPANRREARMETELDEQECADILMVKPAGPYLDIIRELRDRSDLPVAAYQVSGEYSQIQAAAQRGWLDREKCRDESLLGIKRAGADMIFTYFAREIAERT